MTGSNRTITFYFGLGSRYSYLAATQIEQVATDARASIEWRPIISGALTAAGEYAPFKWDNETGDWWGARVSGQYKEAYRRTDLQRWASLYGVPYQEPLPPKMDRAKCTLYCVAAVILGVGQAYVERMFKVIYRDGLAISEDHCRAFATECGLDADDIDEVLVSERAHEVHAEWLSEAKTKGLFGVPTFVFEDQFFWGNDRLPLLAAALEQSAS